MKTRIIYCKRDGRPGEYALVAFDFLGYTFQPRRAKNRKKECVVGFLPAISAKAATAIRATIREWRLASTRNNQRLEDLAQFVKSKDPGLGARLRPLLSVEVCARASTSSSGARRMVRRTYKRFRRRARASMHWLGRIARRDPQLFVLWQLGVKPKAGL